jgi:CheY-like chemotaxis protein
VLFKDNGLTCFFAGCRLICFVSCLVQVMLLRKLGYEISVACNGREALDLLENKARLGRAQEISRILMDASMDVMDGLECTRVIRAQQLPHRVRPFIIAQTANVTEEFRQGCLQAGMGTCLRLPAFRCAIPAVLCVCVRLPPRSHWLLVALSVRWCGV